MIEMLICVTILSILSVGTMMLYVQAIKMYQQGTREATARDKAALALERMMSDIREACNVDYPGPSLIVFTLPLQDADGKYILDAATGKTIGGRQVALFQGDEYANYTPDGGLFIWRLERDDPNQSWEVMDLVMDDVEDLSFSYAPSIDLLELVRVAVTIGQGQHPGYYNRTEIAEVWIRNH